jgi:signal peptidase II
MKIKKHFYTIAAFSLAFAVLDRLVKFLVVAYLPWKTEILPYFSITHAQNTGIAWSVPVPQIILLPLSLVLIVLIPYLAVTNLKLNKIIAQLAVALLIGGGLGNIYDRIFQGYVIDYISVGSWPVFNLADAFLTTGIFIILVFYAKIKRT